jgi:hypothetical protein
MRFPISDIPSRGEAGGPVGISVRGWPLDRSCSGRPRPWCTWSRARACLAVLALGERFGAAGGCRSRHVSIDRRLAFGPAPAGHALVCVRLRRGCLLLLRVVLPIGAHPAVALGLGDRRGRPDSVACLLAVFNRRPLTTYTIVLLPIAVQEMVLAVWLIVKGFGPASRPPLVPADEDEGERS